MSNSIESVSHEARVFPPPAEFVAQANVSGRAAYDALCAEAERDYEGFWAARARENLLWKKPFTQVLASARCPEAFVVALGFVA